MTGLVKVFQVQRIVPNLLDRRSLECFLAYLEFDHENNRPNNQDRIDPPAHAWDVEFQKHTPG